MTWATLMLMTCSVGCLGSVIAKIAVLELLSGVEGVLELRKHTN